MLDSIRSMMGRRQGTGGFGATMPSSSAAGGSGNPSATAPANTTDVAREAGHDDARPGSAEVGSSNGDDQADNDDYQENGDYQDQDDGDFDDGSGDFNDEGDDFGGDDDEA
jgi:hypothetical protein